MSKAYDREQLERVAKEHGVENVTAEEWASVCEQDGNTPRFGMIVAITRIRNSRQQTASKLKQKRDSEKDVVTATFLGSVDLTTRKIDLEASKGQRICLAIENDGRVELEEGTIWRSLKMKPGGRYEIEITRTRTENEETGKVYEGIRVGKSIPQDEEHVQNAQDLLNLGLQIMDPGDVTEDMSWKHVAVRGEISSVDYEPRWVDGEVDEDNPLPLLYNEAPCFRVMLRGEGPTRVKLRLKPTKNGRPLIGSEDLVEICRDNNLDDLINSLVGRDFIGVGSVTSFRPGEPNWADVSCHAIFAADDLPSAGSAPAQTTLTAPAPAPTTQSAPEPSQTSTVSESRTDSAPAQASPMGKLEYLKKAFDDAYDIFGSDVTLEVVKEEIKDTPASTMSETIVVKYIQKKLKEKGHEVSPEAIKASA